MATTIDTIFCDDIRVENTGKLIVIGIYTGNINLFGPKGHLNLTLWVRFFGLEKGEHENILKIYFSGKLLSEMSGTVESDGETTSQAYVRGVPIDIEEDGEIKATVTFKKSGKTIVAGSIPVQTAKDTSSSNS